MWAVALYPRKSMKVSGFHLLLLALFILISIQNVNFLAKAISACKQGVGAY